MKTRTFGGIFLTEVPLPEANRRMQTAFYRPEHPLVIVVGNYGSGKTEVSVNLAALLSATMPVRIVDLDVVNPYFRCREAREELTLAGVRVVGPEGDLRSADLPIMLPEIRGAILTDDGVTILDVGGDDVGARVLASLADTICRRPHDVLQVVNARRPFTGDVAGCERIRREIEAAGRIRVTGIVSNTHLLEETTAENVREGILLAGEVGRAAGLEVAFATADPSLLPELEDVRVPILPIRRRMLKPWELRRKTDHAGWLMNHVTGR